MVSPVRGLRPVRAARLTRSAENRPVSFRLSKAKEILAYLVDRQGVGVTRSEVFATVWEDQPYDRRMQKQLDVYIRSLRDTLREFGSLNGFPEH